MCPFFAIFYEMIRGICMRKCRNFRKRVGFHDRAQSLYEWVEAIYIAFIIFAVVFSFLLRIVNVRGTSMQPNLRSNDKVLLTVLGNFNFKRGDVIVVEHATRNGAPIVKRVIAVAGQTVNIDSAKGTVSINGSVIDEKAYLLQNVHTTLQNANIKFPVTVPAGKLFVLGDNRSVSLDSRSSAVGMIDTKKVIGKAKLILFPFSHFGKIKGET